jgi:predicted pyridoxine 5'-phosphate oxidase superfamily flavin-nucleotide-binding protein
VSLLPDEIRRVLENGIPVLLATCSKDGVPNATIVSQVRYVDGDTVALSFQFFSKTIKNVRENPLAEILLNDLETRSVWRLQIRYDRSETEGPVFDAMDLEIEAIASVSGMSGIFKLRAADLYRVLKVERLPVPS